jgi:hypothetical protein
VQGSRTHLELKEAAVHLVDDQDGLDPLGEGLAEHGLGLDADALDAVDDDEGAVGDAERGRDLGREVDVPGRVDEVDEVRRGAAAETRRAHLVVEGDARGLDGDAALGLVRARVRHPHAAGRVLRDDARRRHQRVGERRLSCGHSPQITILT